MNPVSRKRVPPSLAGHGKSFTPIQGDFFQHLTEPSRLDSPNAGDMDVGHEFLGEVHAALKHARTLGYGRERVVERMNQALPELAKPLTKRQIDCWTAASKEYHELPARFVAAFCWATGYDGPARVIANALGFYLADKRDLEALRLGELQVKSAQIARELRQRKSALGG